MNVDNTPSPDEVKVKLCFFVSVRNATGRSVCGGKRIGSTVGMVFAPELNCGAKACLVAGCGRGWTGYAGVPKPGDDEYSCVFETGVGPGLNMVAGNFGVDTGSSMIICANKEIRLIQHRMSITNNEVV